MKVNYVFEVLGGICLISFFVLVMSILLQIAEARMSEKDVCFIPSLIKGVMPVKCDKEKNND